MKLLYFKRNIFKIFSLLMISFFLIGIGVLPLTCVAEGIYPETTEMFYINDFANVIDYEVKNLIMENGALLEDEIGPQVVLTTVDFTDGISIDEYAADLFNKWALGSAEKNDGLLILLSIGDEDYWAVQGKGLEISLTSGEISQILYGYLEEDFDRGNYNEGALNVYRAFVGRLGGRWIDVIDGFDQLDQSYQQGSSSSNHLFPQDSNLPNQPNYADNNNEIPEVRKGGLFSSKLMRNLLIILIIYILFFRRGRGIFGRIILFPFNLFGLGRLNSRTYRPRGGSSSNLGGKTFRSSGGGFSSGSSRSSFGGRSGGGGSTRGGGAGRRK